MSENKIIEGSEKAKKIVRFADCEGKDLNDVFWINYAKPGRITTKEKEIVFKGCKILSIKINDCTSDRLERHYVSLENVVISENGIMGTIAVKNFAYNKNVSIAYSFDNWVNTHSVSASFLKQDQILNIDYFLFAISKRSHCLASQWMISFAICYQVSGHEYWDNNNGENYQVTSF